MKLETFTAIPGRPARDRECRRTILVTSVDEAPGSRAAAAALACHAASHDEVALLIDFGANRPPPTLLSTAAAAELERRVQSVRRGVAVAARGTVCHLSLAVGGDGLAAAVEIIRSTDRTTVVHLPFEMLPTAVAGPQGISPDGVLLRTDLSGRHPMLGRLIRQLRTRGLGVAVLKKRLSWVVERRASFGALPRNAPDGLPGPVRTALLKNP
jgi:hypothetical protein